MKTDPCRKMNWMGTKPYVHWKRIKTAPVKLYPVVLKNKKLDQYQSSLSSNLLLQYYKLDGTTGKCGGIFYQLNLNSQKTINL